MRETTGTAENTARRTSKKHPTAIQKIASVTKKKSSEPTEGKTVTIEKCIKSASSAHATRMLENAYPQEKQ